MFQEITIILDSAEVMVRIDSETGETLDIYTYLPADILLYNDKEQEWRPTWKPGKKNPLFGHLAKRVYPRFEKYLSYDWTDCYISDEELIGLDPEGNSPIWNNPIIQACRG